MTPEEFKEARETLGLTIEQLGSLLDTAPRTIRKWEATHGTNSRDPNPVASRVMLWMLAGYRPPEFPGG